MSDALRASQRHRDRYSSYSSYSSYLIESLDNLHHYLNYRGKTYHDLKSLKHAVDELKLMIDYQLLIMTKPF